MPCKLHFIYPRATISICGVTSKLAIVGESLALAFLGNGERKKPARHSVGETYKNFTLLQRMIMWHYFIHSQLQIYIVLMPVKLRCVPIPYLNPIRLVPMTVNPDHSSVNRNRNSTSSTVNGGAIPGQEK